MNGIRVNEIGVSELLRDGRTSWTQRNRRPVPGVGEVCWVSEELVRTPRGLVPAADAWDRETGAGHWPVFGGEDRARLRVRVTRSEVLGTDRRGLVWARLEVEVEG